MENSTQPVVENAVLKKVDHLEVLDIVYPRRNLSPLVPYQKHPLEKNSNLFFKRMFDLVLSSLLIICLLSWLVPLIALLIKLNSKGPVFFLQKRNKKGGGVFVCIKFRTMIVNEEADLAPALENDPRITSIGRFLRQRHIDELPQLFNVFAGDMSMIGPRPYMLSDNHKYGECVRQYTDRHAVKPGITGPAQLLGYGGAITDPEKIKERAEMDSYYVNHWSAKMDLMLVLATTKKVLGLAKKPL